MSHVARVRASYHQTRHDYQSLWMSRWSLAMHFGYYDRTVRTHEESLLKMNAVLADYAEISATTHVLDAGCGYGGSTLWLAGTYGCPVHGITMSPEEIQAAQYLARVHGVAHLLEFAVMDSTQITSPDASFDVVWALETLVHTQDRPAFVHYAYRMLRLPTIPMISLLLKITPLLRVCHLLSPARINHYRAGLRMVEALRQGLWCSIVLVAEKREEAR